MVSEETTLQSLLRNRKIVRNYKESKLEFPQLSEVAEHAIKIPTAGFSRGIEIVHISEKENIITIAKYSNEDSYVAKGFEKWISKSLDFYAEKGDLLVLISCSGNSKNLVNANKVAIKKGIKVISLTGCKKNNKLNSIKSNLKIWVNSNEYNLVEIVHHMILLFIVDNLIYSKKN